MSLIAIAQDLITLLQEQDNPGTPLHQRAQQFWAQAHPSHALRACEEAYSLSTQTGNAYGQGVSSFHMALSWFLQGPDYWARASEHLEHSAQHFHSVFNPHAEGVARLAQGVLFELISRRWANRWHQTLEAYLKACLVFNENHDPLYGQADARYTHATRRFMERQNKKYPLRPTPLSPRAPATRPIPQASPVIVPHDRPPLDPEWQRLPSYFQIVVFLSLVIGATSFIGVLVSLANAFWLAVLTGLGIGLCGPFVHVLLIFTVAQQLYYRLPLDSRAVLQYYRGEFSLRGDGGETVILFPILERIRAIVPVNRLLCPITNQAIRTTQARIVVNGTMQYQIDQPLRLAHELRYQIAHHRLGIPQPLAREQVGAEIQRLLTDLMRDAIRYAVTQRNATQILAEQNQILDLVRTIAVTRASTWGITLHRHTIELTLHVA